jgi:uncharacterized membrane protein
MGGSDMAHAREPVTTILSMVVVAITCFVVAKASWQVLLLAFVVVSFAGCLFKLIEKDSLKREKSARKSADFTTPRSPLEKVARY